MYFISTCSLPQSAKLQRPVTQALHKLYPPEASHGCFCFLTAEDQNIHLSTQPLSSLDLSHCLEQGSSHHFSFNRASTFQARCRPSGLPCALSFLNVLLPKLTLEGETSYRTLIFSVQSTAKHNQHDHSKISWIRIYYLLPQTHQRLLARLRASFTEYSIISRNPRHPTRATNASVHADILKPATLLSTTHYPSPSTFAAKPGAQVPASTDSSCSPPGQLWLVSVTLALRILAGTFLHAKTDFPTLEIRGGDAFLCPGPSGYS